MAEEILNVKERIPGKKGAARKLRRDGLIPGVYYYRDTDSIPLCISERELISFLQEKRPVIRIKFEDEKEFRCVIREVQKDTLTGKYVHIDFRGVKKGEKIEFKVPVRLIGTPEGVKEGGILEQNLRGLSISVLPRNIPGKIEIDISHLNISESVYIRDLDYPDFIFLSDETLAIATVVPPIKAEKTKAELDAELAEAEEAEEEGEEEGKEGEESKDKSKDKSYDKSKDKSYDKS